MLGTIIRETSPHGCRDIILTPHEELTILNGRYTRTHVTKYKFTLTSLNFNVKGQFLPWFNLS